jgi:hypothetical protein
MSELSVEKDRSEEHRRRLGNAVKMAVDRRGVRKHPNEIENSEWREMYCLCECPAQSREVEIGLQVEVPLRPRSFRVPAYPVNCSVQPEHRLAPRLSRSSLTR